MKTIKLLLIPADPNRPVVAQDVQPKLEKLRETIGGGWLEAITRDDWHMYVDEEGLLKELPQNQRASKLARRTLVGDAIVLGHTAQGDEANVPKKVLDAVAGWM